MAYIQCPNNDQGDVKPLVVSTGEIVWMCGEGGEVWRRPQDVGSIEPAYPIAPDWAVTAHLDITPGTTRWANMDDIRTLGSDDDRAFVRACTGDEDASNEWLRRFLEETFARAFHLGDPVGDDQLAVAQRLLEHPLPSALLLLLRRSDGAVSKDGSTQLWRLDQIVSRNLRFRDSLGIERVTFDSMLSFAGEGRDHTLAFLLRPGKMDVFDWNIVEDSRRWLAPDLRTLLTHRSGE